MQLLFVYLRTFYLGESHQNRNFDIELRLGGKAYEHEK